MTFAESLGLVAPLYNLVFVCIVLCLFLVLFSKSRSRSWVLLFVAFCVYVFEELLTVLRKFLAVEIPRIMNGVLELGIVLLLIFVLLSEHHRFTQNKWTIAKMPKKKSVLFSWRHVIDKGIFVVAIASPLMTVPQIVMIWVQRSAAGVSIASWGAYLAAALFWLMYGFVHRDRAIIMSNILWVVLEAFVIAGAILFA